MRRPWARRILGVLFIGAGLLHVIVPDVYLAMVPPGYAAPSLLVLISGLAEIAGGLGVLSRSPHLRKAAGVGLVLLLVAVYPANIQMALERDAVGWWLRLPLQGVLVAWVLIATRLVPQSPAATNSPGHASRASSRAYGA